MSVAVDEHKLAVVQRWRHGDVIGTMLRGRHGCKLADCSAKLWEYSCHGMLVLRRRDELIGHCEWSTIGQFCKGSFGCCAYPEEDP